MSHILVDDLGHAAENMYNHVLTPTGDGRAQYSPCSLSPGPSGGEQFLYTSSSPGGNHINPCPSTASHSQTIYPTFVPSTSSAEDLSLSDPQIRYHTLVRSTSLAETRQSTPVLSGVGRTRRTRPLPVPPRAIQPQYTSGPDEVPQSYRGPSTSSFTSNQLCGGYTPEILEKGPDPHHFYGMLIDASRRPSDIFARMADALFFYMDGNSDVLRSTQQIEPVKYGWFMRSIGLDSLTTSICEQLLTQLYDIASVTYTVRPVNGAQVPVLDRRGWLHLNTFKALTSPNETHKHWSKMLDMLKLRDPATNAPFPAPLPRLVFPAIRDFALNRAYRSWQTQLVARAARERHPTITRPATTPMPYVNSDHDVGAGVGHEGGSQNTSPLPDRQSRLQRLESYKEKMELIKLGLTLVSLALSAAGFGI